MLEDKDYYMPPEDYTCLRCEEEEAEEGEDYCLTCLETIKEQNRERFIEEETY